MKKSSISYYLIPLIYLWLIAVPTYLQADDDIQILNLTFTPQPEDELGYVKYKCSDCSAVVFGYTQTDPKGCILSRHTFSDSHDKKRFVYERIESNGNFFYFRRLSKPTDPGYCESCGVELALQDISSHVCSPLPANLRGFIFPDKSQYAYDSLGSGDTVPVQQMPVGSLKFPALLLFRQNNPHDPVMRLRLERKQGVAGGGYQWEFTGAEIVLSEEVTQETPDCRLSSVVCNKQGCVHFGFSNPMAEAAYETSHESCWVSSAGRVEKMPVLHDQARSYGRAKVEETVRHDFFVAETQGIYHQLPPELKEDYYVGLSYCKQPDYNRGYGGTDAPLNRVSLCLLDSGALFATHLDVLHCYPDSAQITESPRCIDLPTQKAEPWLYMQEPQGMCPVWNPENNEYDVYISIGPTQKESHGETREQMRFLYFSESNPGDLRVPKWGEFKYYYYFWSSCLRATKKVTGEYCLVFLRQQMLRCRDHRPEHVRIILVVNPHLDSAIEQEIFKPEGHLAISGIYPTPDGSHLLAFHPDNTVSIYDFGSGAWIANEPVIQGNPPVEDFSIGFWEQTGDR
ncbi:hypothetical protein [Spongorhabdus nitratireducens]